jgi:hypothetical protein
MKDHPLRACVPSQQGHIPYVKSATRAQRHRQQVRLQGESQTRWLSRSIQGTTRCQGNDLISKHESTSRRRPLSLSSSALSAKSPPSPPSGTCTCTGQTLKQRFSMSSFMRISTCANPKGAEDEIPQAIRSFKRVYGISKPCVNGASCSMILSHPLGSSERHPTPSFTPCIIP